MRPITRHLVAVGATAALLGLPAAATANERPADAGQGNRAESTEHDDTNDGGTPDNVVDDGDNAHPSGKDRSVEHGKGGNQGKAKSDPDDDGRGPDRTNDGADRPDRPGGVDKADQDGNNGCGNDDDFEDDNEGWCGGKPKPANSPAPAAKKERRAEQVKPSPGAKPSGDQPSRGQKPTQSPKPTPERATTASQGATAQTSVTAGCPAMSVSVTSTKDLSNVVLVFADGDHQRFEGLSGRSGTFAGTGADAGERIVRVYVKSGTNASGEGPGYGARHDIVECAAATTTTPSPTGSPTPTPTETRSADAVERDGRRRAPVAGPSPVVAAPVPVVTEVLGVVLERPAGATATLPAPGLDVIAAGAGVHAVAAPAAGLGTALPRTGADALPTALLALLALAGGVLAVRRTRSA